MPVQTEYLESMRDGNDPLIEEMEKYAAEHKVPILNWKSAEFLEQLILIKEPKRELEIGTAIAYSSIRIARVLKKKAKLYTIEISSDNIPIAAANIEKAGMQDKIKLIHGDAVEEFPDLNKKFDFIFLDADKEDYEDLLELSIDALKKNGILFVDNLLWQGYAAAKTVPKKYQTSTEHIRRFNERFIAYPGLNSSILPIGDGIGIGIKM